MMKVINSKMINRILALVLAVVLLVGMMPSTSLNVFAEPGNTAEGTGDENKEDNEGDSGDLGNAIYTISGIVKEKQDDGNGEKLSGIKIILSEKNDHTKEQTFTTGDDGKYDFKVEISEETEYEITVNDENYKLYSKNIKVTNSDINNEDIELIEKSEVGSFRFISTTDQEEEVSVYNTKYGDGSLKIKAICENNSTGTISYKIVEFIDGNGKEIKDENLIADYIVVDKNGNVTTKSAGTATVRAEISADENYKSETVDCNIVIEKGESSVTFEKNSDKITYEKDGTYLLTATSTGAKSIKYSISEKSDSTIASVDETTGELTIHKAGNVIIVATAYDPKGNYESKSAEFTLHIEKGEQTIVFEKNNVEILYGEKLTTTYKENPALKDGDGTGKIEYKVYGEDGNEDKTNSIATIDNDGAVTIKDTAQKKIIIKAVEKGDDCYNDSVEISYTINVIRETMPNKPYEIDGQKKNNDNEWFTGDVKITAPKEYEINTVDTLGDNEWKEYIEVKSQAEIPVKLYLRNKATGGITDAFAVTEEIKIDTDLPKLSFIENGLELYKIYNNILYFNQATTITIGALDENSKLESLEYKIGEEGEYVSVGGQNNVVSMEYELQVPVNSNYTIYLKATDMAGNVAEYSPSEAKKVVTDNIAPVAKARYKEAKTVLSDENGITDYYYDNNTSVELAITEKNFDSSEVKINIKNIEDNTETEYKGTWSRPNNTQEYQEDTYVINIPLQGDGMYCISANYTDHSGKVMEEFVSSLIHIDSKGTEKNISYNKPESVIDSNGYKVTDNYTNYTGDNNAKFYYADNTEVTIELNSAGFNESEIYICVGDKKNMDVQWNKEGDKYTAKVDVTEEGENVITIEGKDYSGHTIQYTSPKIIIDRMAPEIEISYEHPQNVVKDSKKSDGTTLLAEQYKDYINDSDAKFYYSEQTEATIEITEDNFNAEEVKVQINGTPIELEAWNKEENKYTNTVPVVTEGKNVIKITYVDYSNHGISIEDSEGKKVLKDNTYTSPEIYVDTTAPSRTVSFSEPQGVEDLNGKPIDKETYKDYTEKSEVVFCYNKNAEIKVEITEDNFDSESVNVTNNNVKVTLGEWKNERGNVWSNIIPVGGEEEYSTNSILITGTDYANREFTYASPQIHINKEKPKRSVLLNQPKTVVIDDKGTEGQYIIKSENITEQWYYGAEDSIRATIEITDWEFNETGVVITDAAHNDVPIELNEKWQHDGLVHTNTIVLSSEGKHIIQISYKNKFGTDMVKYVSPQLIIDQTAPERKVKLSETDSKKVQELDAETKEYVETEYNDTKAYSERTTDRFYYKESATVSLEVLEDYFYNGDVKVQVNGRDYNLNQEWKSEGSKRTNSIEFTEEGKYVVTMTYTDKSGNKMKEYTSPEIYVDKTAPTRKVKLSETASKKVLERNDDSNEYAATDYNETKAYSEKTTDRFYYKNRATVSLEVMEEHFYEEDVKVQVNGKDYTLSKAWKSEGLKRTNSIELTEEGKYVVTMTYTDKSTNEMTRYTSPEIYVDQTAPARRVKLLQPINVLEKDEITNKYVNTQYNDTKAYSENETDRFYYKDSAMVSLEITEDNFYPEDVVIKVNDKAYDLEGSWTENGNIKTNLITFKEEGKYVVTMTYTDKSTNEMKKYTSPEIYVDHTLPVRTVSFNKPGSVLDVNNFKVKVSNFEDTYNTIYAYDSEYEFHYNGSVTVSLDIKEKNFYEEDVTVKVNGEDYKLEDEHWSSNSEDSDIRTNFLTLKDAGEYVVTVEYTDKSGNVAANANKPEESVITYKSPKIVIDKTKPDRNVELSKPNVVIDSDGNEADYNPTSEMVESKWYYGEDAVIKATINEKYFFAPNTSDVAVEISKDGKWLSAEEIKSIYNEDAWTQDSESLSQWSNLFTISEEGKYVVKINYLDPANNKMEEYISPEIYVDTEAPKRTVTIQKPDKAVYANDAKDGNGNLIQNQVIKDPVLKIAADNENSYNGEKYYYKDKAEINFNIEEVNFNAKDVKVAVMSKESLDSKEVINVKSLEWENHEKTNNWTSGITLEQNGIYVIKVTYTDKSGNVMYEYTSPRIFIDHDNPVNTYVKYKGSAIANYYYYNDRVELELNASDHISGIDHFEWFYVPEEGVSDVNVKDSTVKATIDYLNENIKYIDNEGSDATAKFVIPLENADKDTLDQLRGKIRFVVYDRAGNKTDYTDTQKSIVVDNIKPTRTILLSKPKQIVDKTTLKTKKEYSLNTTAEQSGNSNAILYYNGNAAVKLNINEANFYAEDISVYVNGIKHNVSWTHGKNDNWTGSLTFSEDGDYVVKMTYTDRSGNAMKEYQSDKIVIDKINPEIKVKYSNTNAKNVIGGRSYFDTNQKVTITVNEHNFRADDIVAKVTAKDVTGKDIKVRAKNKNGKEINVSDIDKYLSDRNNWSSNGDKHVAIFTYSSDANYTFDIAYKDLALRSADKYKTDKFTVDKKAPSKLKVSYSTPVMENVINNVSFGYYNAKVTVTVSAVDDISGIHKFVYSYVNSKNVSGVNAELIDKAIKRAEITQNGNVFTAKFKIPKDALKSNNQFNGKVEFESYDKADNSKEKNDNKRIVVDNIAPKATIKYNKSVSSRGNIDYYSGNIEATINVEEANFYAQDVKVTIAKNGGSASNARVNWTSMNKDNHVGTFTISGDGDYIVNINYTDRSSNSMKSYKSRQMTIDTKTPTLNVTKVAANSANKDKTYSFTITASDQNFDVSSFKPSLSLVTRNSNGKFVTKTIPLNSVKTSGKNYIITVDNLEEDGLYTLTSSIRDYSNHSYGKIKLDDGKEYDSVNFSINRKGSVFTVDQNTLNNMNKYYIYSVDDDVVIRETNVDPVDKFSVKLNNKELSEGKDYITTQTSKKGSWSVRTYTIKKSLFEKEGEYQIVVESTDKTGTNAYSDVKDLKLSFVVDQKAPILTISGLEKGGRYQVDEQTVIVGVSDDGGKPYNFKAVVLDKSGNPLLDEKGKDISVRVDLKGEELEKYLAENDGKITFTIPEGLENQVKIVCGDYVQKSDTNEYNETFKRVTVSQSGLVIFYANKPLLYSLIGIVVVVIGGIIILIILKRRKRKEVKK
ncbi:MAG: hypothetical protein ACLRZ9_09280 [Eubacterium sp.]